MRSYAGDPQIEAECWREERDEHRLAVIAGAGPT